MPELDLLFLALLFFAEVLGTIGGFGSSMLVMPLAGWFLPFDQALGLTAVFHVFSNAAKIILFRQGVDRRLLVWLGVPAVIGVIIGDALTGGAISGFIAGVAGTGGAVRGITLAAFALEKSAFVATSAWIDMGVDLSRSVVYASNGFVTREVLLYLPAMALISVLGSWLGKMALTRMEQGQFRRVVLALVIIMGAVSLAQGFSD